MAEPKNTGILEEKTLDPEAVHVEDGTRSPTTEDIEDLGVSEEEGKKILRKIDARIIIVIGLVYAIALLDRGNIGLARAAGMNADLELSVGNRYSIIALIFFVPYIIFEFPSTIVIRMVGPRQFISFICFTWGILQIGSGFVNDWRELLGIRILLGILEAGFFPGSLYFLSSWYTRYEVHKRLSWWYLIGTMSSALGGILSYAFSQMKGLQGLNAWRWIFIMEGILTCIVAFQGFILLVNFPEDAHKSWRFLTERESKWVVQQINADRSDALPEKFHFGAYCRTALDFKLWVFGLLFFAVLTTPYAIGFFLPAILGSMGFSSAESQYLTAPPYFFAGIIMVLFGWVGDKYKMRGPLIIAGTFLTIIGLCMTGFLKSNPARYAGVFLTLAGANSVIPALMAYQANNIVGSTKRAMSSALFVGLGGVGGIAGSLVFRQQDAPTYVPGMIACLVLSGFIILTVCVMSVYFRFMNAKADRGEIILENTPGFRYTI